MSVLPDVLAPDLKVVFCGTAVGDQSARAGAYYAGPGNQFWKVLFRIGLTPRLLAPHEFRLLLEYGIGLTDLTKTRFGSDSSLVASDFDCDALIVKIKKFAPQALAFNGKQAVEKFYNRRYVDYGRWPEPLGQTVVFVLPSTSGRAHTHWDESYWSELADFVR